MTTSYMSTAPGTAHFVLSQDGTKISYLTMGSGPAVIVIPGVLSTAADYTAFARALAEHFTVHIIERRGRGESGPQGADYSIRKECEDVFALQQKTGASFLVGHSFGGFVALEAARNNPSLTGVAVYEPGVSINGSIPMNWMPGYQKKLAEKKYLDAFVEFSLSVGPERARKTPPWLMKLMIPLFLSPHELKQRLSLLHECLREHLELGHALHPTSMRTTKFAQACTEPVAKPEDAAQVDVSYQPPVWAVSRVGCIAGEYFTPQPDGTLQCPAGFPLLPCSTLACRNCCLSVLGDESGPCGPEEAGHEQHSDADLARRV